MRKLFRLIRRSLPMKLGICILLLTVPIFAITQGILFLQSRSKVRDEAVNHAMSSLKSTSMDVTRLINSVEDATRSNAWIVARHFTPDSLLHYSRLVLMLNGRLNGCSITASPGTFSEYGRYFSAYSIRENDSIITAREAEYEYFEKAWYYKPLELGRPCWVDPFYDYVEGTLSATDYIASYSYPLFDSNSHLLGVMSSELSLKSLSDVINRNQPFPHSYFMLLGGEGQYLVHPHSSITLSESIFSVNKADEHPDIVALGHEMTTGQRGSMDVIVDGQPCLVCYQPITGTAWSLALVCPTSDIFHGYNRLAYIIFPLLAIGLLVILIISWRIVRHYIHPLNTLLVQCKHIAMGNYNTKIATTDRTDVISRLQNSFATMQQSIDKHVGEIHSINDGTQQRNDELKEAQQMALEGIRQKTVFIQNMSHQIRTPLNIIMGFAQVLRAGIKTLTPEELKSIKTMMEHNARLLNRMVMMLYDSSDSGRMEESLSHKDNVVACNDIARESIHFTNIHFPTVAITMNSSLPDTFTVLTNELYLMRSLRELLYNAAKYSDCQNIRLDITRTGNEVLYCVEDTGPGIDEDVRELMFMPFAKVNDLSEGLGLGLPLAKSHALNLGGDLALDTSYSDGCRFILRIPG